MNADKSSFTQKHKKLNVAAYRKRWFSDVQLLKVILNDHLVGFMVHHLSVSVFFYFNIIFLNIISHI